MTSSGLKRAVPDFLMPFQESLLVQCHGSQALDAALLADRDDAGLVITARIGRGRPEDARLQAFGAAVHLKQSRGFQRPVLLDGSRYSGKNRLAAADPFDLAWIQRQRDLELPVLTDSGYVAEGDSAGLVSILSRAAGLGDAIALLPLHLSWLRKRPALDVLIQNIAAFGVPVAIVLEYADDPFSIVGVADAMLRIVSAGPPALLLRCDISALGALCAGALSAAVGTTTGLRHLYPTTSGGGGGATPMVAAVIRECMSYISLQKIMLAAQADPDDVLWQCCCEACSRVPIRELYIHEHERQERLAFVHSVDTLMQLRDALLTPGSTRAQRIQSWHAHCQSAQFRHMEIESTTDRSEPPTFLRRWQDALAGIVLQQRIR